MDARALLAGPRGRRLVWYLLAAGDDAAAPWFRLRWADDVVAPPDDVLVASLLERAARYDVTTATHAGEALAAVVDDARYWQPPDGLDVVLARPALVDALAPTAAAVGPALPGWWDAPVDPGSQVELAWEPGDRSVATLATWRDHAVDAESRLRRWYARHPGRHLSGTWWSTPGLTVAVSTSRRVGRTPVGLTLVEDSLGWSDADVVPRHVAPGVRVAEIDTAADWARLVARFPLEVTWSRRGDWGGATGRVGRWLQPDFAAAATELDGVHVSVTGYLQTAGRAVDVPDTGGGATVLAGWGPDVTWWLEPDVLTAGRVERWTHTPDGSDRGVWRPR